MMHRTLEKKKTVFMKVKMTKTQNFLRAFDLLVYDLFTERNEYTVCLSRSALQKMLMLYLRIFLTLSK